MLFLRFLVVAMVALQCASELTLTPHSELIENLMTTEATSDGEPKSFSVAVVTNGVSAANGLSEDCNNKFCAFMGLAVVNKITDV